ncbi:MAG: hypothetical protein U9R47_10870, partial [Actinomycetota bacterium]|nr:hypothetical protein [Actinomycetota bacterium]
VLLRLPGTDQGMPVLGVVGFVAVADPEMLDTESSTDSEAHVAEQFTIQEVEAASPARSQWHRRIAAG